MAGPPVGSAGTAVWGGKNTRMTAMFFEWTSIDPTQATAANGDLPAYSETASTYGLGLALLVARGLTSWNVSEGHYGAYAPWYREYANAQRLGRPFALSYSTQAGGLYVRRFANGTVAVNATAGTISHPTYGTLAAHTAVIMLNRSNG